MRLATLDGTGRLPADQLPDEAARAADLGTAAAEDVEAFAPAARAAYPVQQVALTGDLAYTLPEDAPADQVISVVFTQDGTGGHTVTYDDLPVTVDLTAGASTTVELVPVGAGHVVCHPVAAGTYVARKHSAATFPFTAVPQAPSGRIFVGVDATSGKAWTWAMSALYQVDSLTASNWASVTLPVNASLAGTYEPKVVVWQPPGAPAPLMFLFAYSTVAGAYQVWSAPLVARTVAPTWTGPLHTWAVNATMMPTNIHATSSGLFAAEYTGTTDITGGPSIYRTTDGTTWTTALGPTAGQRHFHGVYEDPHALGTIYATAGDTGSPAWVYRSTNGGATFASVPSLANLTWQAVAMGFTADWVWFLSDQMDGFGAYLCDRATMTPRWATLATPIRNRPVPGGMAARAVTDLTATAGTATLTSASAAFTSADRGKYVWGPNGLDVGSYITAVTDAATVTLNVAARAALTGVPGVISGDMFYANAYQGVVDPATGYLYVVANDTSVAGTKAGIFVLTQPGGEWMLYHPIHSDPSAVGHYEMFMAGGYLFVGRFGPIKLITA